MYYGFRSIQKIASNIQRNKLDYNYIKLVVSPGGCVNGGDK